MLVYSYTHFHLVVGGAARSKDFLSDNIDDRRLLIPAGMFFVIVGRGRALCFLCKVERDVQGVGNLFVSFLKYVKAWFMKPSLKITFIFSIPHDSFLWH